MDKESSSYSICTWNLFLFCQSHDYILVYPVPRLLGLSNRDGPVFVRPRINFTPKPKGF